MQTPTQLRAVTPEYMASNPLDAVLERKYNDFYEPHTFGYQAGAKLRDFATRPNTLGSVLNQGPVAGGLLGAAAGGLAGAAVGGIMGGKKKAKKYALLAALLAGGAGAYSGHLRKSASNPYPELVQLLNQANLPHNQKAPMQDAVRKLPWGKAENLLKSVQQLGGAAAGAAIARFLLGSGLLGTVAGGVIGGFVAGSFYMGPRNVFGNPSLGRRDFSGNSIIL